MQALEVLRPSTLDDALAILGARDVTPLAGGTDFMVATEAGPRPGVTALSLAELRELRDIEERSDCIVLGSLVTHAQVVGSKLARRFVPLLVQGCATVGSPQIRQVGTLAGNIMNASPAADSVPPLIVLGAQIEISSTSGRRVLPLEEVITGPGTTVVEAHELVTQIIVPKMAPGEKFLYRKIGQRKALACCIASLAIRFAFDRETRLCSNLALAFGAVTPVVRRVRELETALCREPLESTSVSRIARQAGHYCIPISDTRASAEYRADVCCSLLHTALSELALQD